MISDRTRMLMVNTSATQPTVTMYDWLIVVAYQTIFLNDGEIN